MDGIINVYKEAGFTSFDVVAKLRGILKQKKIGHTGTLDPDAEGVLPVCVGKATKVCEYLSGKDKIYEAVLRLGVTTDTQDASGAVLQERTPEIQEEELINLIQEFTGKQKQIPPMYSALKVNGKKLCDLARKGIEVERKAREIEIYSIRVLSVQIPSVRMQVHCSKGTYIRTLCHDIGEAAGCGGCMEKLVRTKTGIFTLENAHRLSEIEDAVRENDRNGHFFDILMPVDSVLEEYRKATVQKGMDRLLHNGGKIPVDIGTVETDFSDGIYRVYDTEGIFAGLFRYDKARRALVPEKMFL